MIRKSEPQLITIEERMQTGSKLVLVLCFLVASQFAAAQANAPDTSASPDTATVTFTFDFPGAVPDHYSLVVASSGQATYTSGKKSDSDSGSDTPFQCQFTVSEPNRTRIFNLAARASYFEGKLDFSKHRVANTGTKTLAYHDAQRSTQASYNYTENQTAQQLTALFQNISTTLEYARRLQYLYQYQKLALDEELKHMEASAKQNGLDELQAAAPILKRIAADASVMNVTRARAQRLLAARSASVR